MASLRFVRHEKISLKQHPDFSEKWLQDRIAEDASIIGLGDLELIDRERSQERSGRLDLLLSDGDSTRYEVELMLGQTDPSHIIRCIEYWDIERRRYPGYEHVAVLVAEDVTSRFLNIVSLMAGNIPMIAIQLSALKVGDQLVLNFVTVLNQTDLRRDDETVVVGQEADRAYWDAKVGLSIMKIADGLLELVNLSGKRKCFLKYLKGHSAIAEEGDWRNLITVLPKKVYLHFRVRVHEPEVWIAKIEELGLPVVKQRQSRLRVTINPLQFQQHKGFLSELIAATIADDEVEA